MDCALFGMSEPIEPVAIPSDNRILYYGRDRDAFGFLSHFYPSPIELDGWIWPCVEYFYQAQKSSDRDYRRAIMEAANTPGFAPMESRRGPIGTRSSWTSCGARI
jgi:predicted NAD-dependent protein-ADP-ribosyltransferase YbiA (DUF1768 family)